MSRGLIALLFVCLAFFAMNATAQISVGPSGVGPLTFNTAPTAAEFSSLVLTGNGDTYSTLANLDAGVATVDAINIVRPLDVIAEANPTPFAGIFRYNSQLQAITTRPTTGGTNAAVVLLGKFVNNSGQARSSAILTYSHQTRDNLTGGHLYGMSVYWSLTGAPGSWTTIPELNSELNGDLLASLALGSWAQGSTLYVLWVDDNSNAIQDPSYAIDNLSLVFTIAPPVITQQPQSTNLFVNQTIRLSVTATGLGLTYAWFKDNVPIDPVANPTAGQRVLIINGAQLTDSGAYHVTVSNPGGGAVSSVANVLVGDDVQPPKFMFASENPSSATSFRLLVDEPLCVDAIACGTDANLQFNWTIEEVGNPANILIVSSVTISGTNIDFEVSPGREPGKSYRILATDQGGFTEVGDLFNNRIPVSQSVTAAPSRIFIQGVNGYTGTQDAEIHSNAQADTTLGSATQVGSDLDDAGIAQGLFRFDNIFGSGPSQVPAGARIVSATLILNQVDGGSLLNLHRMLVPWDQATVTWNSMVGGLTADNVEVATAIDATTAGGLGNIDVTVSVQAWSEGQANNGWAFLSTGTDGVDMGSSEGANPPQLSIVYVPVVCTLPMSFTAHPQSPTVTEGGSFTLTVSLANLCAPTYQWTKDGSDIPGATASSYTVASAVAGAGGSGGQYRVRVSNNVGTVTSNPGTVTVTPDPIPPVLQRAIGSADGTTVTLVFSKTLGAASAQATANYVFAPAVSVISAVLANGANNGTVTVTTAARTLTTPYRLTISNVRDNRNLQNLISPNPTITDLTGVTPVLPFAGAGNWNYATNSQDANPGWKTGTFGAGWLVGEQFFGFEPSAGVTNALPIQPNPIKTPLQANDTNVLGAGNSEIFVSQYFVKQITLPALEANTMFAISHYIDDGAIFYLDGVEIGRFQMPAGAVTFTTRATSTGEAALQTLLFSASAGNHTLAVEVHQGGVSTSDVVFGLAINKVTLPSKLAIAKNQGTNVVSWTADSSWALRSAQNVNGNYAPVAGSPQRVFLVPPAAQTNSQFYHLQFAP